MHTGVVKWFNNSKGFGFLLSDKDNEDVFAHYSQIEMEGYRTLRAGQQVTYVTEQGPKGLHAAQIKLVEVESQVLGEDQADVEYIHHGEIKAVAELS